MEEKDIKIIDKIIPNDLLSCWSGGQKEYEAIKKLSKAYKQDEKMIEEMAKYIDFDKMNFNCGMCVHDGCQEKCIIDYFRKRCNNE